MSGALIHSPEHIVSVLLTDLGEGTLPSALGAWPISVAVEPDSPDNAITIYGTTPILHGREHVQGVTLQHYGMQLRVRGAPYDVAYTKANALTSALDSTYQNTVVIGANSYLVHAVHHRGIISIGRDVPSSRRHLFTINAIASIRKLG